MRLLLAVALLVAVVPPATAQESDAWLAEARQLFESFDYEQAVPALDRAIAALESRADEPGPDRTALARALEMRGRSRFGLNDREGAVEDFRALLALEPAFAFDPNVSPRVVALLEEVRKATIGTLRITAEPADAAIAVNGRPVLSLVDPIALPAGEAIVTVERIGYRPFEARVPVAAGAAAELPVTLERTSAVVFIAATSPGVEVLVDGVSRGTTGAESSRPLVLTDLAPGTHVLTFRGECRVPEERRIAIEQLADYRLEPVHLREAVATLALRSTPEGATVYLDGRERGVTPIELTGVCEGRRALVLRGSHGRFAEEIDVTAGGNVAIDGVLRPAFALLPAGEPPPAGLPDPRVGVLRALGDADAFTLFVPSAPELESATGGQPLPPDWLAFDAARRPIRGASALGAGARRELAARLSKGLRAEGVATLVQPTPLSPEMVLTLLAAGGGQPDVVPLMPDRPDSVAEALERINDVPPHGRNGIGAVMLEITHAETPLVVGAVEPGGPAERAGLVPGDRLLEADGQPLQSAARLERVLAEGRPGREVTFAVANRAGERRSVQVTLAGTPRLISVVDQTLLFNALAVVLRNRLAGADPAEEPYIRLNLAVALIRIGDFAGAREQLNAAALPEGQGISRGTQLYLLGLVHEGLGDTPAALEAFRAAAAAGGRLTEDGPSIEAAVAAKLNQ